MVNLTSLDVKYPHHCGIRCKKMFYQWNQQSTIFTCGPCKYGENPRAWNWPCLHWLVAGESNLPGNHYLLYWRCWDRIESRDFTNVCYLAIHRQKEKAFSEKSLQKGLWRGIFPFFLTAPVFITGGSVSVWGVQFEIRRVRTIKWKHLTEAPQFILTASRNLFVIVIDTRTRFPLEYNRF